MKHTIYISHVSTPVGELTLGSIHDKLCLCDWRYRNMRDSIDTRIKTFFDASFKEGSTDVITRAKTQLQEYFNESREKFELPLTMVGTSFQLSVWNELSTIPYGETSSYLNLARRMKNEKAIRAIASANGANALAILVPCHRIIGSNGELVGYAGGLPAKQKLLDLESKHKRPIQQVLFN